MTFRRFTVPSAGAAAFTVGAVVALSLLGASRSATGGERHVADHVIFETRPTSGIDYEHIYHSPNICIYGGFNCAIVIYDPDPVNPKEAPQNKCYTLSSQGPREMWF